MKDKILILDSLNQFYRSFIADPSIDKSGAPCGGYKGFMKSLQKLVRETNPYLIVAVWDGAGGSKRKKKMFAEYKSGRKPIHLNRNTEKGFLSDEEEARNKDNQFIKLIEYLNEMPLLQLVIDDVEADDIIARICNLRPLNGKMKIIVSSDKDFFQLCNDEVVVLRPIQDEIMNVPRIVKKFGIHPNNFVLARAIAGDKSDNLAGVAGIGLKTIAKRFPFLIEEKSYMISDVFDFCEIKEKESDLKLFSDILNDKDKIKLNYKMMQLYVPNMPPQDSKKIKDSIDNFKPQFNQTAIIKQMIRDGLTDYNWDTLFQTFRSIVAKTKTYRA